MPLGYVKSEDPSVACQAGVNIFIETTGREIFHFLSRIQRLFSGLLSYVV